MTHVPLFLLLLVGSPAVDGGAVLGRRAVEAHTTGVCTLRSLATNELRTSGGQKVYVNVLSAARVRGSTFLAGHPVFPWPIADTTVQDSLFGVIADDSGVVHLIPAPHPGRRPIYPHILSLRDGIETVFFELVDGKSYEQQLLNEAAMWYGIFRAGRWRNLRVIHRVKRARIASYLTAFVRHQGTLHYLYPLVWESKASSSFDRGAFVHLRRRGTEWTADTLRQEHDVQRARMRSTGRLLLFGGSTSQSTAAGRPGNSVPRFGVLRASGIASPLSEFGAESSMNPDLGLLGADAGFVTWQAPGGLMLRRFAVVSDRIVPGETHSLGAVSNHFVGPLGAQSSVVLTMSSFGLGGFRVTPGKLQRFSASPVETIGLWPLFLETAPDQLLYVATRLVTTGSEQLAGSYLTHLRIACD